MRFFFVLLYKPTIVYPFEDLDNGCWNLRYCLKPFVSKSTMVGDFQWYHVFEMVEVYGLQDFCDLQDSARLCVYHYQHLCQSETFVESFIAGLDVWDYICSKGKEPLDLEMNDEYHDSYLYKSMEFLHVEYVAGFYESLSPSDRDFVRFHTVDPFVVFSRTLRRKIEETEFYGMLRMNKFWISSEHASYNVTKTWHDIWLKVMGEKFLRAREKIYGVSLCPPWTMPGPRGLTCLVVYYNKNHTYADAHCSSRGGSLVKILSEEMFMGVSEFLDKMISLWHETDDKFSFWIGKGGAWYDETLGLGHDAGCPMITRDDKKSFWRSAYTQCSEEAHFICQEPFNCGVQAACPVSWHLSPDKKDCVSAMKLVGGLAHNVTVACDQYGTRLYQFSGPMSVERKFVYGLLDADPNMFYWVQTYANEETRQGMDSFTKYQLYEKYWINMQALYYNNTTRKAFGRCGQVTVRLPGSIISTRCSKKAGGICARDSIRCPSATLLPAEEPTKVRVRRASCPAGWIPTEGSVCYKIVPLRLVWPYARRECRRLGGVLMNYKASRHRIVSNVASRNNDRTYTWKSLDKRLDKSKRYWVGPTADDGNTNDSFSNTGEIFKDPDLISTATTKAPEVESGTECLSIQWAAPYGESWIPVQYVDSECLQEMDGFICERPASKEAPGKCPKGMYSYKDFCFMMMRKKKEMRSWADARAYCQLNAGDLARYDKNYPKKEHFIFGMVGEHFRRYTRPNRLWIGLKENTRDGLYRWLDDFLPVRIILICSFADLSILRFK
ncbi:macrophage mannose receptor 1-like [Elysia marginata]|uniref:Macrophage mannose receptor 1-like n=1 Tax=Elysia marginata TaxID=1093978 RepID=A0AAV4HLX2_9GAST|nr:macrophage mannose receptor 1-like [Elysia marginata]